MEKSLYLLPAAGALEEVAQPFHLPRAGPCTGCLAHNPKLLHPGAARGEGDRWGIPLAVCRETAQCQTYALVLEPDCLGSSQSSAVYQFEQPPNLFAPLWLHTLG